MQKRVTIIGAGLSGLGAAVELVDKGWQVRVFERAAYAGGRCRSYFDKTLQRRIDNGNHLLLSGNQCARRYLEKIGSQDTFYSPETSHFPFQDLLTGHRWHVAPDNGPVPWSLLLSKNRIPGCQLKDYFDIFRLARAGKSDTIVDCLDPYSELFRRLWEPLSVSVLNTQTFEADARTLWRVLKRTFLRGSDACRPMIARQGLSESLIDPALEYLQARGVDVNFSMNLKSIGFENGRARVLNFTGDDIDLHVGEQLILATPPDTVKRLLSGVVVPGESRTIINGHFIIPKDKALPDHAPPTFIGLVGGFSHWLFIRRDVASITISAADGYRELPNEIIAFKLWDEICTVLNMEDEPVTGLQIIREKRATFACTPEQCALRPSNQSEYENLFFAGDWTDTGLPATMEGALLSAQKTVALLEN